MNAYGSPHIRHECKEYAIDKSDNASKLPLTGTSPCCPSAGVSKDFGPHCHNTPYPTRFLNTRMPAGFASTQTKRQEGHTKRMPGALIQSTLNRWFAQLLSLVTLSKSPPDAC
jgi:hypothetical protein